LDHYRALNRADGDIPEIDPEQVNKAEIVVQNSEKRRKKSNKPTESNEAGVPSQAPINNNVRPNLLKRFFIKDVQKMHKKVVLFQFTSA
jgi:hypothetical protein